MPVTDQPTRDRADDGAIAVRGLFPPEPLLDEEADGAADPKARDIIGFGLDNGDALILHSRSLRGVGARNHTEIAPPHPADA